MKKEIIAYNRGYRVSPEGKLLNPSGKELVGSKTQGYSELSMRIEGKKVSVKVHRLQAYQKFGDEALVSGVHVRHLDDDKTNNSWDNIGLGDASANRMDMSAEKRLSSALIATSYVRKYDKEEVRAFYEGCKSYKKTMEKFGISSKGTLSHILKSK